MILLLAAALAQEPVEGQPLAANVERLVQALEFLGAPLPPELQAALKDAGTDAAKIQKILDARVVFSVGLGTETRVAASALELQQGGWVPLLVKVVNEAGLTKALRISSPQSGPVYAGVAELSMKRQAQPELRVDENTRGDPGRFLQVEMFAGPPMTAALSGLRVEYAVALVYSSEAGRKEAVFRFDAGEAKAAFDCRPAVAMKLSVRDTDGSPTTGRFTFRDRAGRVYPPQPKRLAPDFFFQKQIYRHDGAEVLLPPGEFTMTYSRGPEYRALDRVVKVPEKGPASIEVRLERWVDAAEHGFYSGDHHIHAAGCAHYTKPSEGVHAPDMFLQVKGEGLNVGCILTWGPSYDYQHQFFAPGPDKLSEPFTLLKYDVEVSGFGSQALGHVCLLNLKDQVYPGSQGTKGWPTWTTPVLQWAKAQGGVTGYAHSASGLQVNPAAASKQLLASLDRDKDGALSAREAAEGLLPETFKAVDADRDGKVSEVELVHSHDRAADRLPNLAIPEMNSVGAMEIFVTVPQGLCDFISAMDTARIPEWNAWYHLLNCGFSLKASGETDFPCMSSTRVGQGRVYVRLGKVEKLDFGAWCEGIAKGRSYVSDGYAHALEFSVEGKRPGERLELEKPGEVVVRAKVAFGSRTPVEAPYGGVIPEGGRRLIGDTVNLHRAAALLPGGTRLVELIVNGQPVASKEVPADDRAHDLEFRVSLGRSSWVALRHFPQMHANPVDVIVGGKPIRASRKSALWCIGAIEQLWRVRGRNIAPAERDEAEKTFKAAIETYRKLASECPEGT